jgi:Cof subfamily protein (haloacid dehalogenase superfamily)
VLPPNLESHPNPPRVVAADLDGTLLLDDTHELTPLTIAAVEVLERMGIRTILVTGRMFRSAARYADALGLEGPVAAYQGALIREVRTGRLLHHDPVPLDLAGEILRFLEPHGYTVNAYLDDELYVAETNADVDRYESLSGMKANVVGRLSAYLREPATKIGVGADPAIIEALLGRVRSQFAGRVNVFRTWPFFLEMTNATATKARALELLGARLGVEARDVLAFGDSYNDVDMLVWAGTGVAMGGAPPELAEAADFMCEPVGQDGFGRYLMRQPWFPAETLSLDYE